MSNPYTLSISAGDPCVGLNPATYLDTATNFFAANITRSTAGFATAGVPGFLPPDAGTFDVYRRISAHPTVALVMRIVTAPIVANTWDWIVRDGTPGEQVEFVKRTIGTLRSSVVNDAMRALVFGFAAFEKVWQSDGDRMVITRLKPLAPEGTTILVDGGGNFRGVRNQLPGQASRDLIGNKAFCYSYDSEYGNYYGRSRHENIRGTWSMALQTADRLAQYQKKVAGVIAQLHYPEGTSRDAAGVERSNDVVAQQILEAVSMGRSVRFPNLFASIEDPTTAAELAGKSQWVLSQFELGGTDYSPGLLNSLAYYDKLLFRGWLRPERVGLESQHGSRADSQQHSESSIVDSELVDADFASAFNTGVVDDLLEVNFGPAARGAVRVDPSPISDTKITTAQAVLTALLHNAQTADRVASRIDVGAVLQDLDVPDLGAGATR